MRTTEILLAAAGLITSVTSHATFQQLWVNGADKGSSCARLPVSQRHSFRLHLVAKDHLADHDLFLAR